MAQVNCSLMAEVFKSCFSVPNLPSSSSLSLEALQLQLSRYDLWLENAHESRIHWLLYSLPSIFLLVFHFFSSDILIRTKLTSRKKPKYIHYDICLFMGVLFLFTLCTYQTTISFHSYTKSVENKNMKSCEQTIDPSPIIMGIPIDSEVDRCKFFLTSWFWAPLAHFILSFTTCVSCGYLFFWCCLVLFLWNDAVGFYRVFLFLTNKQHLFYVLPLLSWFVGFALTLYLGANVNDISLEKNISEGCKKWVTEYFLSSGSSIQVLPWCNKRFHLSMFKLVVNIGIWVLMWFAIVLSLITIHQPGLVHVNTYLIFRLELEERAMIQKHLLRVLDARDVVGLIHKYVET